MKLALLILALPARAFAHEAAALHSHGDGLVALVVLALGAALLASRRAGVR